MSPMMKSIAFMLLGWDEHVSVSFHLSSATRPRGTATPTANTGTSPELMAGRPPCLSPSTGAPLVTSEGRFETNAPSLGRAPMTDHGSRRIPWLAQWFRDRWRRSGSPSPVEGDREMDLLGGQKGLSSSKAIAPTRVDSSNPQT